MNTNGIGMDEDKAKEVLAVVTSGAQNSTGKSVFDLRPS